MNKNIKSCCCGDDTGDEPKKVFGLLNISATLYLEVFGTQEPSWFEKINRELLKLDSVLKVTLLSVKNQIEVIYDDSAVQIPELLEVIRSASWGDHKYDAKVVLYMVG